MVVAARKPEPGCRVDDLKWFGDYGVYLTIEDARAFAKGLNEKGGYREIRIVELKEVEKVV